MKQWKIVLLSLFAMSTSSMVFAAPYGMAGCGVGSLILKDKPGKIQLFAATTNQYFGQTSSITSGTSNCREIKDERAGVYMMINHDALMVEISKGQGETVANLARIYKCQDIQYFSQKMQKSFNVIYPDSSSSKKEVVDRIFHLIKSDEYLQKTCSDLS